MKKGITGHYNLAVCSKIHLDQAASLSKSAYSLGKQIATLGHTLLSLTELSLVYRVAKGNLDRAGLSIGFSPAGDLRYHVSELQLPTDVYDWIYFSNLSSSNLLSHLIAQSQGLILVGAVMENLTELALATEFFLPTAILLDPNVQENNSLLNYLKTLPVEKQKTIVVHEDYQILLNTLTKMLVENYKDINEKVISHNNDVFGQLLKEAIGKKVKK